MKGQAILKSCVGLLAISGMAILLGVGCPQGLPNPGNTDSGDGSPTSSAVLGVVYQQNCPGGPLVETINVDILQGGNSIFGGFGANPQNVIVPCDQTYGTQDLVNVGPAVADARYGHNVQIRMAMVTQDGFGESMHMVSLHFSGWVDDGDGIHDPAPPIGAGGDLPASLPVLDLAGGDILVRVADVEFDLFVGGLATTVSQAEARIAGSPAQNQGMPYIFYMRDGQYVADPSKAFGRFYNLQGIQAVEDPATVPPQDPNPPDAIPDRWTQQVPGDYFFNNPTEYVGIGFNNGTLSDGPGGMGSDDNADNLGEFEYQILGAAFNAANNQLVFQDPANPLGPGNQEAGSGAVHELAVSCIFITQ